MRREIARRQDTPRPRGPGVQDPLRSAKRPRATRPAAPPPTAIFLLRAGSFARGDQPFRPLDPCFGRAASYRRSPGPPRRSGAKVFTSAGVAANWFHLPRGVLIMAARDSFVDEQRRRGPLIPTEPEVWLHFFGGGTPVRATCHIQQLPPRVALSTWLPLMYVCQVVHVAEGSARASGRIDMMEPARDRLAVRAGLGRACMSPW